MKQLTRSLFGEIWALSKVSGLSFAKYSFSLEEAMQDKIFEQLQEFNLCISTAWQPIETAPKDQYIDIWEEAGPYSNRCTNCKWNKESNHFFNESGKIKNPTYWMKIPKGPL